MHQLKQMVKGTFFCFVALCQLLAVYGFYQLLSGSDALLGWCSLVITAPAWAGCLFWWLAKKWYLPYVMFISLPAVIAWLYAPQIALAVTDLLIIYSVFSLHFVLFLVGKMIVILIRSIHFTDDLQSQARENPVYEYEPCPVIRAIHGDVTSPFYDDFHGPDNGWIDITTEHIR